MMSEGKDKILVVEDSKTQALRAKLLLEGEGYEVEVAGDGEEAIEKVLKWRPDAVLLDINMPKKDGFEVLREIRSREELANLQVIMLTQYGDVESLSKALELGADDYISKPFNEKELSARIKAALRFKKLQDKLIESERLAAIGALVVTISHEINNPLTGIIGHCQIMLMNRDKIPEEFIPRIESVLRLAERIAGIVSKISNLKKASTKPYLGEVEMLDLGG